MNLEQLFAIANAAAMPAWLLLVFAPTHALTQRLVRSGAWSLAFSALYVALLVYVLRTPGESLTSLAALQRAFSQPAPALLGWVHYLAFDLLVGVRVAEEGLATGRSRWFMAPFLFLTLMLGPSGFLAWRIARAFRKNATITQ
jgi:Domain of unknown function (DUF4281)